MIEGNPAAVSRLQGKGSRIWVRLAESVSISYTSRYRVELTWSTWSRRDGTAVADDRPLLRTIGPVETLSFSFSPQVGFRHIRHEAEPRDPLSPLTPAFLGQPIGTSSHGATGMGSGIERGHQVWSAWLERLRPSLGSGWWPGNAPNKPKKPSWKRLGSRMGMLAQSRAILQTNPIMQVSCTTRPILDLRGCFSSRKPAIASRDGFDGLKIYAQYSVFPPSLLPSSQRTWPSQLYRHREPHRHVSFSGLDSSGRNIWLVLGSSKDQSPSSPFAYLINTMYNTPLSDTRQSGSGRTRIS